LAGTDSAHGVRQRPPLEARASAPGGLDSIVTVAVAGGSNRSMLGMYKFGMFEFTEQHASAGPHSTAMIARDIFMSALLARLDERRLVALPSTSNDK
jgi:hypothetical protein